MKQILLTAITLIITTFTVTANDFSKVSQGTLRGADKDGRVIDVPLKHTEVTADISGFLARVNVKQEFRNDSALAIEAIYMFPLSHDGAVDRMRMKIGSKTINGVIMKREEARATYEKAKQAGQRAALLDQERPNIFTQRVANIMPGDKVVIEISYVETLKYEAGSYEFVFPMVVGPRYNPASKKSGATASADVSQIKVPVAKTRTGHDISVNVNLNAGVPIENFTSKLHDIESQRLSPSNAAINLKNETSIPNKDFILHYDVTGRRIEDAILTHRDERGGFFTMMLQPPDDMTVEDYTPKEIVFVLDTSGSMGGFPIEKAKEAMKLSLEGLHPRDSFNIITFAGSTKVLFEKPVPATLANLETARTFLETRRGGGGTEMMKAIKTALEPSDSQEHLRIVCFMTDGYVGNDMAIVGEIKKHPKARVFSFGIGNSVNRYLIEKMADAGKGEAEVITLKSESQKAAERFYKRVRTPVLTDISIDWNGLPVEDIYPSEVSDLFTAKPLIINGRYKAGASGSIKIKGLIAGQHYEREIKVEFPEREQSHDVLATLWARRKVSQLMMKDPGAIQEGTAREDLVAQITSIGLEFKILTQFTSFVAVEEGTANPDGNPRTVEVPSENPDGHRSKNQDASAPPTGLRNVNQLLALKPGVTQQGYVAGNRSVQTTVTVSSGTGSGSGGVVGYGFGGGNGGGIRGGKAKATPGNSSITKNVIKNLPAGTTFSSLLKMSPNTNPQAIGGRFQIDGTEVTNFRTGTLAERKKDDLTTTVADLKKPVIPARAKWSGENSVVEVDFKVDETGQVIEAKARSGNKILKKPSEEAALGSKFTAPMVEGDPMRMNGRLAYKFIDRENVEITLESMSIELTPAKKRELTKKFKLHSWIYGLVDRLEKGAEKPSEFEPKFVENGIADIRVVLADGVQDGEKTLKKAGLKIYKSNGSIVYGKIKAKKVYGLAELDEVKYVTP
ncbi:MAG: VWA domain-containing protein [Pyrinomonadaceae bacterium]|nr:VWA domain-containing protein [Pyrinomonadaceae bacterium]